MQGTSLFRIIIDNINDGVFFVDLDRRISLWNKAAEAITGYSTDEVLGRQCQDEFLQHIEEDGGALSQAGCPLQFAMDSGEEYMQNLLLRHKRGHLIPVGVHTIPVFNEGKVVGAVEIFAASPGTLEEPVEEFPVLEPHQLDELTGLPGKAYMETLLAYKFRQMARFGAGFCVLFADLDNFEAFNNYYGRETGDVVLQSIGASFKNNLQGTETIGRWGGEEFVGLFDVQSDEDPYNIAEKIRVLISRSAVVFGGNYLSVTASVGVTVATLQDAPEGVIARADDYMYQSKRRGKNCSTIDVLPSTTTEFTPISPL